LNGKLALGERGATRLTDCSLEFRFAKEKARFPRMGCFYRFVPLSFVLRALSLGVNSSWSLFDLLLTKSVYPESSRFAM
jgi:hypothetical protein